MILYHIHVSTPELAIERVLTRVSTGGHPVPVEKIISRHPRTLLLMREAVQHADLAYVFDNSRLDYGFTHVATFESGRIRKLGNTVPDWVRATYREALRSFAERRIAARDRE